MNRGQIAALLAACGVVLAGLAVVRAAMFAATGAYLLLVAPLIGLPVAMEVYRALQRVCTTASRRAEVSALAGVVLLVVIAFMGASFGGVPLLLPALFLACAAVLTPRAGSCRGTRYGT